MGNCVGMVVGVAGMTVKFCMLQLLPEQHSISQSSKVMLAKEELNAAQIASLSKVKKKQEVNWKMCVSELLLRAFSRQNVKNVNGRGSTEYKVHTNIMHRSGEVMYKYTKHRFLNTLLLEIRASLYSIPSDAIFISKFWPFSENSQNRQKLTNEVYFLYAMQDNFNL